MNNQPNKKQEAAGHVVAGIIGTLLGLAATGGKLEKALVGGVVSVIAHAVLDRPITFYIAGQPQDFPRFLTQ